MHFCKILKVSVVLGKVSPREEEQSAGVRLLEEARIRGKVGQLWRGKDQERPYAGL